MTREEMETRVSRLRSDAEEILAERRTAKRNGHVAYAEELDLMALTLEERTMALEAHLAALKERGDAEG